MTVPVVSMVPSQRGEVEVEEAEEVVKMGRTTGGSGSVVGNNNNTLFPAYGYDTEEGVVHNVVASSSSSSSIYSQSQVQVRRTHAVPVAASAATASAALPSSDCIKVIVRIRPPLSRELNGPRTYSQAFAIEQGRRGEWSSDGSSGGSSDALTLSENLSSLASGGILDGVVYNSYRFAFDRVYGPEASQEAVYGESARDVVMNVLQGYNASIIAYGQTGAGKTYTMTGDLEGSERGVIPRAVGDLFERIASDDEAGTYLVRASYLQVYNEVVSDLLASGGGGASEKKRGVSLAIREDAKRGVYVEGLSEWVVRGPGDVYDLMARGAKARTTGATRLNELSSRSHAIFRIVVEKSIKEDTASGEQTVRMGKLNLVDLAGSERVHMTGASGARLQETKKINQSLSALGNVIGALTSTVDGASRPGSSAPSPTGGTGGGGGAGGATEAIEPHRRHVPYRDSKLTRILEDSLGGNCKTAFVAVISPAVESFSESLSTLKFANRAKKVKNAPRVNEDESHRTLLKKYERELKRLRAELQARGKDLVDKRLLLQLEEARRKEHADKMAAMSALERQSAEIARQKAAMASLQKRISSMQGQLLVGGQSVEDTPAFRTLLAQEQSRIKKEYEKRLAEMESERKTIAEDKAATEKLKGLLLKQRDVMIALTHRLGERDQEVLELQASLEATEKKLKETEDALDRRTAQMIRLRKGMAGRGWQEEEGEDVLGGIVRDGEEEQLQDGPLEVTMALDDDDDDDEGDDVKPVDRDENGENRGENNGENRGDTSGENEDLGENVSSPAPADGGEACQPDATTVVAAEESAPAPTPTPESTSWQSEKDALKTILELKVLSVIGDVEANVQGLGASSKADDDKRDVVVRQVAYLKKLVEMTVVAMTDAI